jgi:hypothetical protein
MTCAGLASAQPTESSDDYICVSIPDAQEVVRRLSDYDILREMDQVKDQRISNLEKEIDLQKRENELKDRIIGIKDMEIEAQKRAFDDMKEVTDRALKLAETSKPKSNWEIFGIIGVAAFVIGLAVGL